MADMQTDILVAGTGPAGLVAALAMAETGRGVVLAGPPVNRGDGRTTTIMMPGMRHLERFGLVEDLMEAGAPLRFMRLVDATGRLLRSPTVTFRATEIGEDAFGYNIPNAALNDALGKAVTATASIRRIESSVTQWVLEPDHARATLGDGTVVSALLAVAADGRNSPAREAAGIAVRHGSLPQAALVLAFAHTRPHDGISTEFHTPQGPFTQVPLPGPMRSSLVWVCDPAEAARLAALPRAVLSRTIEDRMESMLGKVTVETDAQVFPLTTALPARFAASRVALVGEAAHVFPPIGAQGLNLGLRDVRDLAKVTHDAQDPGADAVLAAYDRARRPDIMARSGAVNALNRSLLSGMLPAQMARGIGIGLLGASGPLRGFFMREGMEPGSGFGSFGRSLREKVRRQEPAGDEQ
ncbi:MAG: UbiH/UbiF family hydroxylase [Notoacmeibacter sp.]|nr:UbiH/UbiF family hydroxylase [Notoacmeibacter sp.]MCC0032658.1 UbiH/UbiF family hydroxylase [Brucellaceae bacterium]